MTRRKWWRKHWQKMIAGLLWLFLLGGLLAFLAANQLAPAQLFLVAMGWVNTSPVAPLAYIVLYVLRPLIFFSSIVLTLAGGFLFGPAWGIVYTTIGANLSATVAYLVGRYFGRGILEEDAVGGLMQRYARRMRESSFETVLIMRFIFLPYDLVNYAAGFLRIHYWPFLLATILGSIPGTIMFVSLGASLSAEELGRMILSGELPALRWELLALSALMFVVSLALSRYFRRREQSARPAPEHV